MKPKVLAIVGPTAVGKSDLGLALALRYQGEIISGDALQVYRQLDIGTAKDDAAMRARVPHHLIDIRSVHQSYSAYDFQQDAQRLITEITARGHLPIIVGGTGFYLRGLLANLPLGGDATTRAQGLTSAESTPTAADSATAATTEEVADQFAWRAQWQARLEREGADQLWAELQRLDPAAAAKIPVSNPRRLLRALMVIETTGRRFSDQPQPDVLYDSYVLGLTCPRPLLYQRINQRVEQMMAHGLPAEARWLAQQVPATAQAAKGIGYREFYPYFAGEGDLATVTRQIQVDSRHYAKRQLTYFRHQLATHWFDLLTAPTTARAEIDQALADWL